MPRRPTIAKSPVRAALLLAACAVLPAAAWAAHPVPVFQVDAAGQSAPALQQAMRAALVRATGHRESAADPAFAALIADAPKYVRSFDRGPRGELQVVFDEAAVEKAIAALDRSIWDPTRPFTLVVLYPPPDQADQATDQAGLEQEAEERGLPISIVPLPVTDDSGNLLPRQVLLTTAQRYGAEQLLVGKPPPAGTASTGPAGAAVPSATAPPSAAAGQQAATSTPAPATSAAPAAPGDSQAWQWTLYTDFGSQSWSGPLTAGIDDTVSLLAPPAGPASANAPEQTEVEIEGVTRLADYANIELMLAAVPGVSAANVSEVGGETVTFVLTARGGAAAIDRALSGSPSFARVGSPGASGGPLVFRYRSS
jgi:Uncharacterized protein conserved in bacteria (DUF2066)